MNRKGITPAWGIPEPEDGILVSSIEYTPSNEVYEQLDHQGEVCGLVLYKQKVEMQMSGQVPMTDAGSWNMGASVTLANDAPASVWLDGQAPEAVTTVITAAPYTLNREGAQEVSVSATIYPFASTPVDVGA